jgi:hypothetical protein
MAATIDGRVGINFVVRCRGYFDQLFSVGLCGEEKKSYARFVAGQATQSLDEIGGQRFVRDVLAAIGVASRNGIVKLAVTFVTLPEGGMPGQTALKSYNRRRKSCPAHATLW